MKETKEVKQKKIVKEKVKGMLETKNLHQEAAGHNSEPPKHIYFCGSWSFIFFARSIPFFGTLLVLIPRRMKLSERKSFSKAKG